MTDFAGKIYTFEPSYESFHDLCGSAHKLLGGLEDEWLRKTRYEEVVFYLTKALKIYAVRNLLDYRRRLGICTDDTAQLDDGAQAFLVPRYFRDLFREFSRPMVDKKDVYIPNIEYDSTDPFTVGNLGYFSFERISTVFRALNKVTNQHLVTLDIEQLNPAIISFYHKEQNKLFAGEPLRPCRTRAVMALKHCRFKEIPVTDVDSNSETKEGTFDLLHGVSGGDFINGRFFRTAECQAYHFPPNLIYARFPTGEEEDVINRLERMGISPGQE